MAFDFLEILIFVFSIGSLPSNFISYKRIIKNKLWWTYSFSGHALLVSSSAILISNWYDFNTLRIIAGSLMFVSGYGGWILSTVYTIENKKLFEFFGKLNTIVALVHHFFMAVIGIWFLFAFSPTLTEVLMGIVALVVYSVFMWDRINVPWILYKPSKISLSRRKFLIRGVMIFFYILLPALSFFTKA